MRVSPRAASLLICAALLAGCGGAGRELTVSAAASLKDAFTSYARSFRGGAVHFSFAGSDALAAQIRAGLRPDVYAAADTSLPRSLAASGLVEPPATFASNRLVLAIRAHSRKVHSVYDLERPGVTLALGAPAVPVGAYARRAVARLGPASAAAILAHVRSSEPDVAGVVAEVSEGAVDAGFVYESDVVASHGDLQAIALPVAIEPRIAYAAAVVRGAEHPQLARAFIRGLLSGAGQAALERAGLAPPPRR